MFSFKLKEQVNLKNYWWHRLITVVSYITLTVLSLLIVGGMIGFVWYQTTNPEPRYVTQQRVISYQEYSQYKYISDIGKRVTCYTLRPNGDVWYISDRGTVASCYSLRNKEYIASYKINYPKLIIETWLAGVFAFISVAATAGTLYFIYHKGLLYIVFGGKNEPK